MLTFFLLQTARQLFVIEHFGVLRRTRSATDRLTA